jgi:beta-N-acetylhexosaminidase
MSYLNRLIFLISTLLFVENQGHTEEHSLTLDQKIGQLFIVPACQLRGEDHFEDLERLIRGGKVGGIILKQGTAQGQKDLIDKLQKIAPLPLLCLQDGEWGLAMRLDRCISFPRNLTLGAIQDTSLLYQLGSEIGAQCRLVGIHVNLAPVADVNCNPLNPIIHMRSFGQNPQQVTLAAEQVMLGMQSQGIYACAKHFPGHGDTSVDSHVDLPLVTHNREELESIELFPFQQLIKSKVKMILSAHLYVEALAEETLLPATFSKRIITDLLQNQMGFDGLIITDALNMKALTKNYSAGEVALRALTAGHDLLLYGDHIAPRIDQILREDVPAGFDAIKRAVENKEISEEMIDEHVNKILKAKRELALFQEPQAETNILVPDHENLCHFGCVKAPGLRFPQVGPMFSNMDPLAGTQPRELSRSQNGKDFRDRVLEQINTPAAYALKKRLFQEAMTLVRNEAVLPLSGKNVALIPWGDSSAFKDALEEALPIETVSLNDPELFTKLQKYDSAILALSKLTTVPPHFGLGSNESEILGVLSKAKIPIIAVVFGSPYSLARLPFFEGMIVAYENETEAQEAAAEVVLGKLEPKGRLPIDYEGF